MGRLLIKNEREEEEEAAAAAAKKANHISGSAMLRVIYMEKNPPHTHTVAAHKYTTNANVNVNILN